MKSAKNELYRKNHHLIIGLIVVISLLSCCKERKKQFLAPVFKDIGSYRLDVTYSSAEAKMFFDQGMIFTYGFNHGEAARSFREAIRLDSSFAMAYWGLAYTLGPNYNAPMENSDEEEVKWAVEEAYEKEAGLKDWERGLIHALKAKHPPGDSEIDLDAFASKMKMVYETYPTKVDLAVFYAESLMLIHPWDLYEYKGGAAKEWTGEIVNVLEKAIAMNSDHPLANHLYIHATEASSKPELAYEASKFLTDMIIPGAGHLVHMPSHTYINTGDYHLGTEVNLAAVKADSIYSAQCVVQGAFPLYYYHNYHFLAACAALEGRGALAIESSFLMTQTVNEELLATPGFETTQHFMTIPYNVLVKFAQWEKILTLQSPDVRYPYMVVMWHYARGMAYANLNQLTRARKELEKMDEVQKDAKLSELLIFGINAAQDIVNIGMKVLESEVVKKGKDFIKSERLLKEAIAIEDGLSYNEPPDWFFSARHLLGDLYMHIARYEDAEKVYRKDLINFPKNGFALNGLYQALKLQGKEDDRVKKMFESSWSYADTHLKYSRVDFDKRENLTLRLKSNSPKEMAKMAVSFCGIYL